MSLKHWATPETIDELRCFLGLACYYEHFVHDYSKHAAPLNLLTRKDVPFFWGEDHQESFEYLKASLASTGQLLFTEESRMCAPGNPPVEPRVPVPGAAKRRHSRPLEVKNVPAYDSGEVELQKQAILDEDLHLDDVDELDYLLAEQQKMQCSNWEHAQDADPVIKRIKELMREFGEVAPNPVQLRSQTA